MRKEGGEKFTAAAAAASLFERDEFSDACHWFKAAAPSGVSRACMHDLFVKNKIHMRMHLLRLFF
jgi:hypothetical protein